MRIIIDSNPFLLRFDRNEDVIERLIDFAKEKDITAASFTAIGATSQLILSYYDLEKKQYLDKTLYEDLEIASVIGNIAQMDGKRLIHAHGCFGDKDLQTYAGHIKRLIVSATCEVTLIVLNGTITRAFDNTTGLNLLN